MTSGETGPDAAFRLIQTGVAEELARRDPRRVMPEQLFMRSKVLFYELGGDPEEFDKTYRVETPAERGRREALGRLVTTESNRHLIDCLTVGQDECGNQEY